MRIILQRVSRASVSVQDKLISSIGQGFVLLVGVAKTDTEKNALKSANKVAHFRIFSDKKGKMNLSLLEVNGEVLSIPQFTVVGNTQSGNRPGFDDASNPLTARKLWTFFNDELRNFGIHTEEGLFGEHMEVTIINNGPVTFVLEN